MKNENNAVVAVAPANEWTNKIYLGTVNNEKIYLWRKIYGYSL